MYLLQQRLKNTVYLTGLACIAVSLFFFSLPVIFNIPQESVFSLFVANYGLAFIYLIVIAVNRRRVQKEAKIHHFFLFLILGFISAWSLNRGMTVFDDSVTWFTVLLFLLCANYMSFAFSDALPKWAVHGISFISGISFITFTYLAAYLSPLYGIGVAGFFLLGISLHTFIPLLISIYTLRLMNRVGANNKKYWWSFTAGSLAVIAFVASYVGLWNNSKKQLDNAWKDNQTGFPAWVNVTQNVPANFFVHKLLKAGLVYSTPEIKGDNLFLRIPSRNFGERRKHDPLVMTAAFFSGNSGIEEKDKMKIIKSMFGFRHEGEERLWSGDHLYTEHVDTEVKLWAACNIAYTEKTIKVTNKAAKNSWPGQEEAIYTFYLPEGGVVTSLSLWINGREEKGIMTTKEKANSAYKAIVGVERRDPSVVHWQEGNTVSVRVFPVIAGESRLFRIGITAPLERVNGNLQYENVYFNGPDFNDAEENIQFHFEEPVEDFQLPASFVSLGKQSYKRQGNYVSVWSMQIKDPGLSNCTFSFDNNTYSLTPYHKRLSPARIDAVYLDINRSWSKDEFNKIVEMAEGSDIFVFDSALVKLQPGNKNDLWQKLHSKRFSLFPLFEISEPSGSLLVTKNHGASPNLDDLAETGFMTQTKNFLTSAPKIKLFDLGQELSPWLKSMKEFRVFQYEKGDLQSLKDMVVKGLFPDDLENDEQVIIHQSDMVIQKKEGSSDSSGPDHLMRLFTYNHIMQKLGSGLLTNRPLEDSLVEEARKAYVVTPVSSLIVLETQMDYDRFEIKDSDISLKNASLQSKGAVPEPHEWALIILAALVLAFVIKGKKFRYN